MSRVVSVVSFTRIKVHAPQAKHNRFLTYTCKHFDNNNNNITT